MPIHNWNRVEAGLFHHFHQSWTVQLGNALNSGLLPDGFFALAEQVVDGPIPDVVTLQSFHRSNDRLEQDTLADPELPADPSGKFYQGAVAVEVAPPIAWLVTEAAVDRYATRANRIVVRHSLGQVVAVIEIVSPGNKSSQHALTAFVNKAEELLLAGVNLLIVDLFAPSTRDPQGIHKAIWDRFQEEEFELPTGKSLTAVAYAAMKKKTAYVEPLAIGDPLPSLPIFLDASLYVPAPLETTYNETWSKCPAPLRNLVESL